MGAEWKYVSNAKRKRQLRVSDLQIGALKIRGSLFVFKKLEEKLKGLKKKSLSLSHSRSHSLSFQQLSFSYFLSLDFSVFNIYYIF